jgi:preprotein translocase subunit SecD
VRARFDTTDAQLKAKDDREGAQSDAPTRLHRGAEPGVALARLAAGHHAKPMYLGLDLRGGVHFMLQVDMRTALTKNRTPRRRPAHALRDKNIRHGGISREGQAIEVAPPDPAALDAGAA